MITLTKHLKTRLKQRKIPARTVIEIFNKSKENYYDNLRNHNIVIANVTLKKKAGKFLVAYDKIESRIEAVTIHPINDKQIKQRLDSGRWTYENKN